MVKTKGQNKLGVQVVHMGESGITKGCAVPSFGKKRSGVKFIILRRCLCKLYSAWQQDRCIMNC